MTAVTSYFPLINLFALSSHSRQNVALSSYGAARRSYVDARKWRGTLFIFAIMTLALPVCAEEFIPERVVFPITDFKPDIEHFAPLSIKFGTGFCLDPDCRFVGTNYHVAKLMGKHVRIKGVLSAHLYLDSNPDDIGAQDVKLDGGGLLKFTPAHDLAIYEMRHPLKNFNGIAFDSDDLGNSFEADIYAYPFNGNPKRGLICWHAKFLGKTPQGTLAFGYEEGRVRGGASGGIVVESKTKKIVGILSSAGDTGDRIALAVPVKELSDFVMRAQPYLQGTLFPKSVFVSPVAADLYRPYVWPRAEGLSQRPAEPAAVVELRRTAQHLADSMQNFTAIETFAWGRGNRPAEETDAYETLVLDGWQRWRHPGSKRFHNNVPFPSLNEAIVPGAEWSYLPQMVGTELDLKIHQAPDAFVGGRTIHVFQWAANVEDRVCTFHSLMAYGFFERSTWKFYDCHGEVWVDESGTILRISEALDLSGPWYLWRGVMTYGWLEKNGTQYAVPVTLATQAGQDKMYWCQSLFMDYEMFGVKSSLVLPTELEQAPKSAPGAQ